MPDPKTFASVPELTNLSDGDIIPIYDISASAPRTRGVTVENLRAAVANDGTTDLSVTRNATTVTVVSSTGADATLPAADSTNAGIMTAAQAAKLAQSVVVADTLALAGGSNTSPNNLTANTRGVITLAGSATHTITLPTGATNDAIERRVEVASGTTATINFVNQSAAVIATYTATDGGVGWYQFSKASGGWIQTGLNLTGVSTGGGGDTTDPTVSSLSPADNASSVAVGANLVVTFSEAIAVGTGNVTIKNLTDSTQTTIAITAGSPQIVVSGSTLTINPGSDLTAGKNYAIQIAATCIDDLAGNSFAGILDDTTWNFATASASVTSDASVVLDARALSYANDTPIDNASAKWTDTSTAGTNHGIQATSNLRPLVKTSASESGSARVVRFDPATTPDNVVLTSAVSLTGAFTLALKFKAGTRDGALVTNAGVSSYITGIVAMNGSITATTDGDAVDSASVATGGKYHSAPTGVFYNDGVAGNATFTTTINGSGALTGVTIGGTNTGYDGTVTAVFDQLGWAQFGIHDGSVVSGPTAGNLADGNFHNLIVTRNSSNLVRWELDGTEVGTATHSGTLSAGQIGTYLSGDIEAVALWTADKTADLAAIRTFLG